MLSLDEILRHNNFRYTDEIDSLFEQQLQPKPIEDGNESDDIEMKKVLDENDYVEVIKLKKNIYVLFEYKQYTVYIILLYLFIYIFIYLFIY